MVQNGICNKKIPPVPLHRPVTRKFAAQLAENNPQGDRIKTDVEEGDFNEPMFVQHTEAMLEEIDRMEGIEMEDSNDIDVEVEESVMDIDSCDKNNPLAVEDTERLGMVISTPVVVINYGANGYSGEKRKAPAVENQLPVSLEDLYNGVKKKMRLSRNVYDASGYVFFFISLSIYI
ncbi:unnamed protein product [Arabidopsis lyrata]|nr:unnamed protein product [Arabidopsis lyrata]